MKKRLKKKRLKAERIENEMIAIMIETRMKNYDPAKEISWEELKARCAHKRRGKT